MSIFTRSFSQEENVQIELVKFSLLCNPLYRFRDLIGQHNHTRKRGIGIDISSLCLIIREVRQMRPFFFATLLVRIGPVINLFLNELTGVQSTERRARQIQVILRRNREPRFIIGIAGIVFRKVFFIRVFIRFEQLLRIVLPCTKMILIKNDEIPVGHMHPLIIRLNTACILVHTKEILERTEADDRPVLISTLILLIIRKIPRLRRTGDKLPAVKIDMSH